MLILEGAQAGLSWIIVLKKRERYRAVFDNFDMERVARYNTQKIAMLLEDPGIIRNRLKVSAAVKNAQAAIKLRNQYGSLSAYLWQFVDGKPQQHHYRTLKAIPASTPESEAMSKALKKAGCTFVGSTICYAFMQAVGMVNDHVVDCYRYRELAQGVIRSENQRVQTSVQTERRVAALKSGSEYSCNCVDTWPLPQRCPTSCIHSCARELPRPILPGTPSVQHGVIQ